MKQARTHNVSLRYATDSRDQVILDVRQGDVQISVLDVNGGYPVRVRVTREQARLLNEQFAELESLLEVDEPPLSETRAERRERMMKIVRKYVDGLHVNSSFSVGQIATASGVPHHMVRRLLEDLLREGVVTHDSYWWGIAR